MKKIVVIGTFFLVISMVIGVTWIGPVARSNNAEASAAPRMPSCTDGRRQRHDGERRPDGRRNGAGDRARREVPRLDVQRNDAGTGDSCAPGRHGPFHAHEPSTIGMQHSIDFHAAMTPWADLPPAGSTTLTGNYQPVNPGETKTFDWVAMFPACSCTTAACRRSCNTSPTACTARSSSSPRTCPPSANTSWSRASSTRAPSRSRACTKATWTGCSRSTRVRRVQRRGRPVPATPLEVRPNEPFRIWVVNAGPTLDDAFHVIGTMFDKTYPSGNLANTLYGLQTYNIPPGDGGCSS